MRNTIARCLEQAIEKDRSIVVISADLGYSVFDHLRERFPDNFINIGIAENSMVGIAAGLALAGRRVFIYSISKFLAGKCFEQIREDVCFHNLPVTFIGAGAGFAYGFAGYSHFCIDDVGILRQIPDLEVCSPCDNCEAEKIFWQTLKREAPTYIRIGKREKDNVIKNDNARIVSGAYYLKHTEGNIIIASYGTIMSEVLLASELLIKDGIDVSIVSCPIINPVDMSFFKSNISNGKKLFVVEEHYIDGGLGDALSQFSPIKIAIPKKTIYVAGTEEYMRQYSNIDANSIVSIVKQFLKS